MRLKSAVILGIPLTLSLYSCGVDSLNEDSELSYESLTCDRPGYRPYGSHVPGFCIPDERLFNTRGKAKCTGQDTLRVRENPSTNSEFAEFKCLFREVVEYDKLIWNTASKEKEILFARLPGKGKNGTNAYADVRYLEKL